VNVSSCRVDVSCFDELATSDRATEMNREREREREREIQTDRHRGGVFDVYM